MSDTESHGSDAHGLDLPDLRAALSLLREQCQAAYAASLAASSLIESSSETDGIYSVNWIRAKILILDGLLRGHSSIFRSATGFSLNEWERFCQRCVPLIITYARDTGEPRIRRGRPS
jgi:hypothetical protein